MPDPGHDYHTARMERCIKHLTNEGWDAGKAHAICYATLGEGANKAAVVGAAPKQADAQGWRDAREWSGDRIIEGVITREQVDLQGDVLQLDGFDMERFAKNGHLIMEHGKGKSGVIILGECIGWRTVGDTIESRFGLYNDGNPMVDAAWGRMKEAGLKGAFSVGAVPLEEPVCDAQSGVCLYKRVALQEVSWTSNPANPAAKVTFIESKAASLGTAVLEPAIVGRFVARQKAMPNGRLKVEAITKDCGLCAEYQAAAIREGKDPEVAVNHMHEVINTALDAVIAARPMPDPVPPQPPAPEKKPEGKPGEENSAPSMEERVAKLEAMVRELVEATRKGASAAPPPAAPAPAPAPAPAQKSLTDEEMGAAIEKHLTRAGFKLVKAGETGPTPATGTTPGGTAPEQKAPSTLIKDALADEASGLSLMERLQRRVKA